MATTKKEKGKVGRPKRKGPAPRVLSMCLPMPIYKMWQKTKKAARLPAPKLMLQLLTK